MNRIPGILKNRDAIFIFALALGLSWDGGVALGRHAIIPALGLIMTLSLLDVSGDAFRSPRQAAITFFKGIGLSFGILTGFLLATSHIIIADPDLRIGFIMAASVPPAIAIVPFTGIIGGDRSFSLLGVIGGFLAALFLTPSINLLFIGSDFIRISDILPIVIYLIVLPLVISRIRFLSRIEKMRGTLINWVFFVVFYTMVGANRGVILHDPLFILPSIAIAFGSTFILGAAISFFCRRIGIKEGRTSSVVLLGTLKNYGLSAGLSLSLFGDRAAIPSAVLTVFLIGYFMWLSFIKRKGWGHFT